VIRESKALQERIFKLKDNFSSPSETSKQKIKAGKVKTFVGKDFDLEENEKDLLLELSQNLVCFFPPFFPFSSVFCFSLSLPISLA